MPDAGIPSAPTSVQSPTALLATAQTVAPAAPATHTKTPEELANELYQLAAKLLSERTPREIVEARLMERGIDRESSGIVVGNLLEARAKALKQAGLKNMVYGALWLIGGVVLTAVTGGQLLFYGAVIVGVIQGIRGVFHYAKGSIGGRW